MTDKTEIDDLKEYLSDIDAPNKREDGAHVVTWRVIHGSRVFPCSSISLALAVAKRIMQEPGPCTGVMIVDART
jgi:hypothetical protein